MSTPTPPQVPAGWYPDPAGSARSRWWDGTQWTDHFSEPYAPAAQELTAPEGTKAYNVWIWLAVLLPYVTFPTIFLFNPSTLFSGIDLSGSTAEVSAELDRRLAVFTSPWSILLSLVGYAIAALTIFFAYKDWRALQAAGVPRPFHWAFAFLNLVVGPVYAIGRGVVVKRRTGHGSAVLWVTIVLFVVSIVIAIIWAAAFMSAFFELFAQLATTY